MRLIAQLAWRSAWSRRGSLALLVLSIATSTVLFLGLDLIRQSTRSSFANAVSGTDLIVGAQNSGVSLLLYSVFRLGEAAPNMPVQVISELRKDPRVASVIPIALGDSFQGFPVVGTEAVYFEAFRFGQGQGLSFAKGQAFSDYKPGMPASALFDAVVGSEVARRLNLGLGDSLALTHGVSLEGLSHADKPFQVAGVLAPTGTPVDRSVHISLQGMEAIHLDWAAGVPVKGAAIPVELSTRFDVQPKSVTAALVSLKSRALVFRVQRGLENHPDFSLTALLPGVALSTLWDTVGQMERLLAGVSALVAMVSVLGLTSVMLVTLGQRRRELAVLRSVGAGPGLIVALLQMEVALVMLTGLGGGILLTLGLTTATAPWVQGWAGVQWVGFAQLHQAWWMLAGFLTTGLLLGLLPAWLAYRRQLQDGLSPGAGGV